MDKPVLTEAGGLVVRGVTRYLGPSVHSRTRLVRIELELGELEYWPTNRLEGLSDRLLAALPLLREHGCSYGEPGGFVRRLEEGTWLGHVIEHVALALQEAIGHAVSRGKTRGIEGEPGVYNVMFEYAHAETGLLAGRLAIELVDCLLPEALRGVSGLERICPRPPGAVTVDNCLQWLSDLDRAVGYGPTTASLVQEALRRDIPVTRIGDTSLVRLGQGRKQRRIRAAVTSATSGIACEIASDKDLTRLLLQQHGLPAPDGGVAATSEEALQIANRIGFPVVAKPLDGNHGRGVSVGICTAAELELAFATAREHSPSVVVERHVPGCDHRILVIGGRVAAAAERRPAAVRGDGRQTIEQLVAQTNGHPCRGEGHDKPLTRIAIDAMALHQLELQGLTPVCVPPSGETVLLQPTANLSTGGTAVDRTDAIHPDNAEAARRAAAIVGLDIAGVDFVTPDITRSYRENGGAIIEVNAGPGFRMHLQPTAGPARNVAAPVVEMLFPGGENGRIPVLAVTGTNGKTTTSRMLAHILRHASLKVGLASSTGVHIDGRLTTPGDCTGPNSALAVLNDPEVDIAVLETARGGILREGLGFDRCDVGAVLNVAEDHLGLKGVRTLEQLAAVKMVVVEAVRRGGTSVLNADDRLTREMAAHAGGSVCFFSAAPAHQRTDGLRRHIALGRPAATIETHDGAEGIVVWRGGRPDFIVRVDDIPATHGGSARFNVANALAAAAMAHAQGVASATIATALRSFGSDFAQSPGRLNIVDAHGVRVVVDYAHNPHGLKALCGFVREQRRRFRRATGLIGAPGDRRDVDIREMGRIAARNFDRLVLKEDDDPRGRPPGAVARLLRHGALDESLSPAAVEIILNEAEAVRHCLDDARPGDLLVITADAIEPVWRLVEHWATHAPLAPAMGSLEETP